MIEVGRASCQPLLSARGFQESSGGCWVGGGLQEMEECVGGEDGAERREEPAETV